MIDARIHVANRDYTVLKFIGKGKSGYSYLASSESGDSIVVKRMHSEPCSFYTFSNKLESEKNAYIVLKDLDILIPELLEIVEPDILIKSYVEGKLLAEAIADGMNIQKYIIQMIEISNNLEGKGINIDYFPTNFIIKKDRLYYIDYEINSYMPEYSFQKWGIYYWLNREGMRYYLDHHSALKLNTSLDSGMPITEPFEELKSFYFTK